MFSGTHDMWTGKYSVFSVNASFSLYKLRPVQVLNEVGCISIMLENWYSIMPSQDFRIIEQIIEQIVQLPEVLDTMTLTCHPCNDERSYIHGR